MIAYCDRLTIGSCVKIIQIGWRSFFSRHNACRIQILDPLPQRGISQLLQLCMQSLGFRVQEAKFFAGHLRMPDGQVVFSAARIVSIDLAFKAAERILMRSKFLKRLNQKWGHNTIFKRVARTLEMPAFQIALRFMVAEALIHEAGDNKGFLIVQRFPAFDPDLVCGLSPSLKVYFYRSWVCPRSGAPFNPSGWQEFAKRRRASVLLLLMFAKLIEMKCFLKTLYAERSKTKESFRVGEASPQSLLVLNEDDLSLDRSYRTQPHWLFPDDGKPEFRTIVLHIGSAERLPVESETLKKQGIIPISRKNQYIFSRNHRPTHPIQKRLNKSLRKSVLASLFGSSAEVRLAFEIARLLNAAKTLVVLCEWGNITAFMNCDNYLVEADAMELVATELDITTISYQYSNVGMIGPIMMTGADIMATFAPLYHRLWIRGELQPKQFVDIGYVYDTSFEYVRARANACRLKLMEAGAQFIICYFDENPQDNKYSLISTDDYCSEILALLRLLLEDSSIGLVIKTQFQWNSPQYFEELADVRSAAEASGRYVELNHGVHRNIIFPAEAAFSSDMAIGHSVGATAALEAALTGVRCILLNPYEMKDTNTPLYAQADIVYPSMASALEAIRSFRSGASECARLGDWTPIIDHFDPFRDGRSGHRLRNLLERVVLRNNP
jgi:hypothetical protein